MAFHAVKLEQFSTAFHAVLLVADCRGSLERKCILTKTQNQDASKHFFAPSRCFGHFFVDFYWSHPKLLGAKNARLEV